MKITVHFFVFAACALAALVAEAGTCWREAPAGVPGAVSVTSTENGKTSFECFGYADLEAKKRMTPDTVFWMASNTKGVAAATALAVVGEGKLLLDDPVEKYFPSWKKLAAKQRPTLRMLLSHTAGLPFFTDRPLPGPGMAALAERAAEQPLAYEPGTEYRYSNWGIDVAMAMVEKATGRPFEVEMAERLFKPLGMTDTTFVPSADQRARQAVHYRLSDKAAPRPDAVDRSLAAPYLRYGEIPEAGGGLLSTPRDMIKFFRMIADGGKAPDGTVVIPAGLMKAWLAKQTPAGSKVHYSFGMHVGGKDRLSHGGQSGTWGEADVSRKRARLFMVNVTGSSAAYQAFRKNWMKVTDLSWNWYWYPSYYLAMDRTPEQRQALCRELWQHEAAAETRVWPEGKVPFRRDDKPLKFVENELWQRNLVVTDINDPFFVFYKAKARGEGEGRRPVVVVLPGGGYSVLGWNKEGTEVAQWLNANGISAAVLLYRAPDQRTAALCDVQRTIGLLRRDAAKYGIDPTKVGVIGFSAGANLAVTASTSWRKRAYERVDDADDFPCRPDFQLPIYLWDVLERDPAADHIAPLLVNGTEPKVRADYPVDAETPPAFLAQAKDDFCQIETTVFYARALEAAGVRNCRTLLMDHGGHGYGLRTVGNPTDVWSREAAAWLDALVRPEPKVGVVVVPPEATDVERFAARELADGLRRVTRRDYAVTNVAPASGLCYLVGGDPLGEAPWKTDEIRLVRKGDRVILTGDLTRGALYAVNEYLEQYAGVRWWTRDEADYPHRPDFRPPLSLDVRYAPPFAFRETFYHGPLVDAPFKVRMKSNTTSYTRYIVPPTKEQFVPPEMGGNHKLVFFQGRRSAYHSFFEVLPPAKYAKDHPDWYSEVDGKRIGRGQLCVTNPEMQEEYVKNTLELLRQSPDCDSVQVSQNDDARGICTCAKCRAAFEQEGAWSGPYLAFANRVAEAIEKEFPKVTVDTFAYQFTRKAPKSVRPRKNVVVRLCDIECSFNRPLADPAYPVNATFVQDLEDWSKVAAGNLYLWDYQANFTSYMLPHPNLHVFADNLRLFRKYGAIGIFEQGDAMCPVGDFAPLKQYVTAHLVWNPDLNEELLADEFLKGYYGAAAAPYLRQALDVARAAVTRPYRPVMRCYHDNVTDWIDDVSALEALKAMEAALAAATAEGGPYSRRVRQAKMSWDHARILNWDRWEQGEGRAAAIAAWKASLEEFKIDAYRETTTRKALEDYLEKLK